MAAYIIATVRITDREKFMPYLKAIEGLCERHGGEYVTRGKVAQVLEGDIDPNEIVVVSRFPTAEAALGYAKSPEYLAGAKLRAGAGTVETRLLVDPA